MRTKDKKFIIKQAIKSLASENAVTGKHNGLLYLNGRIKQLIEVFNDQNLWSNEKPS